VTVLPIADRHIEYARRVQARLVSVGLRVEVDARQEKIGYKIREAQLHKVPYMLVVGDKEAADGSVGVRHRVEGDRGSRPLDEFVREALLEVSEKRAVVEKVGV
jgi:threonyl-tRNA synthetase